MYVTLLSLICNLNNMSSCDKSIKMEIIIKHPKIYSNYFKLRNIIFDCFKNIEYID